MGRLKKVTLLLMIFMFTGTSTLQGSVPAFVNVVNAAPVEGEGEKADGTVTPVVDEDEKEEDDKPIPGGKENVYRVVGTNAEKRGRVNEAVKYNEQMHYLMTYTILKGKYMEVGDYSAIYTKGQFAEGANADIEGISLSPGYGKIILDSGDVSDDPHIDDVLEEAKKEEAKIQKERDEAIEGVTQLLTDELVKRYIHKYYLSPAELPSQSLIGDTGGLWIDVNKNKRGEAADVATHANGFRSPGGTYALIRDAIEATVRSQVNKGTPENAILENTVLTDGLSVKYREKHPYVIKRKIDNWALIGREEVDALAGEKNDAIRRVIRFFPLRNTSVALNDKAPGWEYNDEYRKDHDAWKEGAWKTLKESKQYKRYAKAMTGIKEDEEKGSSAIKAGNIAGLAWIPLTLKMQETMKEEPKYLELIQAFDGGKVVDKDRIELQTLDGKVHGARALQVNDIFNMAVRRDGLRGTSGSPYFTYDYTKYKNKDTGGAYIGSSDTELGAGIGLYAGMKMKKTSGSMADWVKSNIGINNGVGIVDALTKADYDDPQNGKLYPHMAISSMATNIKNIDNLEKGDKYVVGIDNYGNIVSGDPLAVIVPYWQNTVISDFKEFNTKDSYFMSTPIYNSTRGKLVNEALNTASSGGAPKESVSSLGNIVEFPVDTSKYSSFLGSIGGYAGDAVGFAAAIKGSGTAEETQNIQALALAIVGATKTEVASYNAKFVDIAIDGTEMYLQPSTAGYSTQRTSDDELLQNYTNKDLLDRIMMILDVGFYEVMRLTIASWVVSFYTGSVVNFSMAAVFHTTLITDTSMWSEVVNSIGFLLIGFMGLYMLFMAFRLFRNTMSKKDFIKQFLAVSLVIIIPTVVYAPLIHTAINKPTPGIVGTQMEQMSLLDAYIAGEEDLREQDAMYKKLFGSSDSLRNRADDYILDFYTTQHVDGFDVMNVNYEDLSYKNQFRNIASDKAGKWRKSDLVKVRVSIFDLFKWVESGEDIPLFEWLVDYDAKRYGEVIRYKEFKTSTAVNYPELGVSHSGAEWSASDLYRKIFKDTADKEIKNNITGLYGITEAFRNREKSAEASKITDDEREALVRDLAMTADSREILYGDGRQMSYSATMLMQKYGRSNTTPKNDFLGLADVVNDLVPYRDMTTTSLDRDVYNINKKVIDNYIANYSIVRETVGDKPGYGKSEFHMIVMHMWFSVNDTLDLPMFPRTYAVDTISFDSYMRLLYIPMDSFVNIEDKDLDNVSQYIALREHPGVLLLGFLPALLLLVVFGAIYIITFYVLMMVMMTISFVWNYIIRFNPNNKSWLGALMIIGSFALAKIGLLTIWKAMSWYLNYSYVLKGGLSYPYVMIHSLVLVVYLILVIWFVFLNVFKAVWKDKGNLGGEIFANGVMKVVGGIQSKVAGWQSKGRSGKDGNSVDKAMAGEGEEGRIKTFAGGFTVAALRQKLNGMNGANSKTDEDIYEISQALLERGELGAGSEFLQRFGKAVPGLQGKLGRQIMEDYDDIEGGSYGLTKGEQASLEAAGSIGGVISTTADGSNITTLDAVSPDNAKRIAAHLKQQGLSAVANGSDVVFNSQGVDLANAAVRKGLFGGLMDNLLRETDMASKTAVEEVKDVKDYEIDEDGVLSIGIGESGIATGSVNSIMETKTFRDSFDILDEPVKKDGQYLQGTMRVIPKAGVDVEKAMTSLYGVDDTVRGIKGDAVRSDSGINKGVKITEEEANSYSNMMVDGMLLQNGRLLYNESNEEHKAAADTIVRGLKQTRDQNQRDKADIMMRLASQVTAGGNSGFRVTTANTATNDELRTYAQATNLVSDKISTRVFGGTQAEKVTKNIEQMRNVLNASPATIQSYTTGRDELYRAGEAIMEGKGGEPDEVYGTLMAYATKNDVNKRSLMGTQKSYAALGKKKANSEITDSAYNREVEILTADVQIALQDEGKYDSLMLETLRKDSKRGKKGAKLEERKQQNTALIDGYIENKKALKAQGVDSSTLERFQQEDFDTMGQLVGDIEAVKQREDGTLEIQSHSRLDEGDIATLIGRLDGSILAPTRQATAPVPPVNAVPERPRARRREETDDETAVDTAERARATEEHTQRMDSLNEDLRRQNLREAQAEKDRESGESQD